MLRGPGQTRRKRSSQDVMARTQELSISAYRMHCDTDSGHSGIRIKQL